MRSKQVTTPLVLMLLLALLVGGPVAAPSASTPVSGAPTAKSVDALALKWFAQMQKGQVDRSQLSAEYNAHLTDSAVHGMSQYLEEHNFGAPPTRAEIVQERTAAEQTFYEVKLIFPRGDAASLLFGFDVAGKITGVSLLSMAGD